MLRDFLPEDSLKIVVNITYIIRLNIYIFKKINYSLNMY
jgi:hypothetical protein